MIQIVNPRVFRQMSFKDKADADFIAVYDGDKRKFRVEKCRQFSPPDGWISEEEFSRALSEAMSSWCADRVKASQSDPKPAGTAEEQKLENLERLYNQVSKQMMKKLMKESGPDPEEIPDLEL